MTEPVRRALLSVSDKTGLIPFASKLASQTLDPLYSTPEQFAERLQSDYRKYAEVVKISGATIVASDSMM